VQELRNELALLVAHSKEQERSSERDKAKNQDVERRLKDKNKEVDELREVASSSRIESQSLAEELKREREEFHRLENYSNEVVEQYNKIYHIVSEREAEVARLSSLSAEFQRRETQQLSELAHYERELRGLDEELRHKDEELQRMTSDRDVYRAEANSSRRSLTGSTDWKLLLEDKVRNLEAEYLAKKGECEGLRGKVRECERIIEEERQRSMVLEGEVKRVRVSDSSATPAKMFYKSMVES
jgi:chromosome segregation ATPase